MFWDYVKSFFVGPSLMDAMAIEIASLKLLVNDLDGRKNKSSLTLVSPNGVNKIVLTATDYTAGMWISADKNDPAVAIYNQKDHGAVIGIWGKAGKDGNRRGALDVAIAHTLKDGGTIQMIDAGNKLHFLTADSLGGETTQLNTTVRF